MLRRFLLPFALLTNILFSSIAFAAQTFGVAAYNVENYLDQPTESRRYPKSAQAKATIRISIVAMKSDVIAFEETGGTNALFELCDSLKTAGLDLPCWEDICGLDTNIHDAVLSKFPFTARRAHTNDNLLFERALLFTSAAVYSKRTSR
jgi:hypothetical protein